MITAVYASLLAIWLVFLSFRVIALRGSPVFAFLYLLETNGTDPSTLHGLGLAFLIGRLMHGICFGFMKSSMSLRIGGTVLTLTPLLVAALMLASIAI